MIAMREKDWVRMYTPLMASLVAEPEGRDFGFLTTGLEGWIGTVLMQDDEE